MFQALIIEGIKSVQITLCNAWISSGKYRHAGKTEDLSVPGETIIASNEIGILNMDTNGNQKCAGQQVKIGNSISNDVVELVQSRIIIREIKFKELSSDIEALEDHIFLPENCRWTAESCQTGTKTYVWKLNKNQCPYKLNKKLNLKPIKNTKFQVDETQQVVLQRKNMVSTDNRCPNMKLFATEYDNLFLTTDLKVTFKMVDDVDFITLLNLKLEYSFFISEKEIMKQNILNSINTCKMRLKLSYLSKPTAQTQFY